MAMASDRHSSEQKAWSRYMYIPAFKDALRQLAQQRPLPRHLSIVFVVLFLTIELGANIIFVSLNVAIIAELNDGRKD